jgi:hypothetical protein
MASNGQLNTSPSTLKDHTQNFMTCLKHSPIALGLLAVLILLVIVLAYFVYKYHKEATAAAKSGFCGDWSGGVLSYQPGNLSHWQLGSDATGGHLAYNDPNGYNATYRSATWEAETRPSLRHTDAVEPHFMHDRSGDRRDERDYSRDERDYERDDYAREGFRSDYARGGDCSRGWRGPTGEAAAAEARALISTGGLSTAPEAEHRLNYELDRAESA